MEDFFLRIHLASRTGAGIFPGGHGRSASAVEGEWASGAFQPYNTPAGKWDRTFIVPTKIRVAQLNRPRIPQRRSKSGHRICLPKMMIRSSVRPWISTPKPVVSKCQCSKQKVQKNVKTAFFKNTQTSTRKQFMQIQPLTLKLWHSVCSSWRYGIRDRTNWFE